MLSAATAYGGAVTCTDTTSDTIIVQSAVNAGGTVSITGTCNFSGGGVNVITPVVIQGSGSNPTIHGNGSSSGFAFTISADHVTITGLTFNSALGAAHLVGLTRQYFTFTNNTVENTNGRNAIQIDQTIRYGLIDSNFFYNIAPNGFQSATYASLGFGGCYSQPAHCDISGEAISITGGMDNTSITNNRADYVANNFMHADWHIVGAPTNYYLTTNNSVSYNTLTHIHRMGIELQGTSVYPYCGVNYNTLCNFTVEWTANIKVAGNYYHLPFLPYQTYGYSLVFQGSGVEINNAAIADSTDGQAAQALENLGYGILTQGNVFAGEPLSPKILAWGSGIVYGYNGAIPGSVYTTQNNVLCSISTSNFGTENNGGGQYLARAVNQYNFISSTCPNAGHLTTSGVALAFEGASASGTAHTFSLSAVSTLPIKWVEYFVDGTPVGVQEIQDTNPNFTADQKWLYHATVNPAPGNHKITATATDVAGGTSSVSQAFTN